MNTSIFKKKKGLVIKSLVIMVLLSVSLILYLGMTFAPEGIANNMKQVFESTIRKFLPNIVENELNPGEGYGEDLELYYANLLKMSREQKEGETNCIAYLTSPPPDDFSENRIEFAKADDNSFNIRVINKKGQYLELKQVEGATHCIVAGELEVNNRDAGFLFFTMFFIDPPIDNFHPYNTFEKMVINEKDEIRIENDNYDYKPLNLGNGREIYLMFKNSYGNSCFLPVRNDGDSNCEMQKDSVDDDCIRKLLRKGVHTPSISFCSSYETDDICGEGYYSKYDGEGNFEECTGCPSECNDLDEQQCETGMCGLDCFAVYNGYEQFNQCVSMAECKTTINSCEDYYIQFGLVDSRFCFKNPCKVNNEHDNCLVIEQPGGYKCIGCDDLLDPHNCYLFDGNNPVCSAATQLCGLPCEYNDNTNTCSPVP